MVEILESYGFQVAITREVDWCGTPVVNAWATGHGLVNAVAFERDMPLAETVADAGVVVRTGERVGFLLYPEKAIWWEPHSGIDVVMTPATVPEKLDDSRWQGGDREEVQRRHDAQIGGNAINVMANTEYKRRER
jgi:hypothetical protein